jgi:hypothetical protein
VTSFTRDLQRWLDPADAYTLSDTDVARMTRYLDRLDLQPRFPQMLVYLQGVADGTNQDQVAVNSAYHPNHPRRIKLMNSQPGRIARPVPLGDCV